VRARCGLEVDDIILEQLASSYAVLTEDEKELGVCLVDIGGGTTDIAVFTDGAIRHTGGDPDRRRPGHQRHRGGAAHADAVRRGHQDQVRLRAGAAGRPDETIEVPSVGDRPPRAWRARRWPRWSSRATTSCSRWSRRSCAAAASRSDRRPASC
jgi:cell division protein FtsA